MERLQKIIASSGYCSRRKAEELIKKGLVFVDGEKVTELGTKVSEKASISINGEVLAKENKEYYLLYKPVGVVTTTNDEKKRRTVVDLINTTKRIYPVGRLDYDTTGVLLLTNDGDFANILMHPSNQIDKVYLAKIDGILGKNELQALRNGVLIDGFKTAPAKVKIKQYSKSSNMSLIEITIHEGKNHQVKKMFEAVNHKVIKLKRESVGFFDLEGLKAGEYRRLTIKEVKKVYALQNE
mgnify:FL=1